MQCLEFAASIFYFTGSKVWFLGLIYTSVCLYVFISSFVDLLSHASPQSSREPCASTVFALGPRKICHRARNGSQRIVRFFIYVVQNRIWKFVKHKSDVKLKIDACSEYHAVENRNELPSDDIQSLVFLLGRTRGWCCICLTLDLNWILRRSCCDEWLSVRLSSCRLYVRLNRVLHQYFSKVSYTFASSSFYICISCKIKLISWFQSIDFINRLVRS